MTWCTVARSIACWGRPELRVPPGRHGRRRSCRDAGAAARPGTDPGIHAGGDPRRGARAQRRRRARHRRADHARQHLSSAPPARRGCSAGDGWSAPIHDLGAPDADRLGRLSGLLARGAPADLRARSRVPESHRRYLSHAHPRARDGDPMDAGRGHRDGVRPRGARVRRRTISRGKAWSERSGGWTAAAVGTPS